MDVEVLVSCIKQEDLSIIKKLKTQTDVVIINQCGKNFYIEDKIKGKKVKMIFSEQKGLTKSRNLALNYATKDICILCDDDVVYKKDYNEIVLKAFQELKDADIIVFNIERTNYNREVRPITKIRRAHRYKSFGSVRIAFKRKSILQNNIWFDVNFGSGSIYSSGEETILFNEAYKKKLKIYEHPSIIATVDFKESTWRTGCDEKFFYDKGALLAAAYDSKKYLFMFYYVFTLRNATKLTKTNIIKWLIRGMKGYKSLKSYEDYKKTEQERSSLYGKSTDG